MSWTRSSTWGVGYSVSDEHCFSLLAKRLAGKRFSEMTHFGSSGMLNHNSIINQAIDPRWTFSSPSVPVVKVPDCVRHRRRISLCHGCAQRSESARSLTLVPLFHSVVIDCAMGNKYSFIHSCITSRLTLLGKSRVASVRVSVRR